MAAEGAYPSFIFLPLHSLCPEHLKNHLRLPPILERNASAAALPVNDIPTLHTLYDEEEGKLELIKGHKRMDPLTILGGKILMTNSGTGRHSSLQKFKPILKALSPSTPVRAGTGMGQSCGNNLVPVRLRLPCRYRSCELDTSHISFLEKRQTLTG